MTSTPRTNKGAQHGVAVQASHDDRARMLRAMASLESALASGAVHRQASWKDRVMFALGVLEGAMEAQAKELDSGVGVLAEILDAAPRFERQVIHLRDQYADLVRQIHSLREQFNDSETWDDRDVGEVRQRLAWLIAAIRHFQARESDLLWDAFRVDIGVGD